MKILLDTDAFLYFILGSSELSAVARGAIEDPDHQKFLSVASLWEISIKVSIKKLEVGMTMSDLVVREVRGNAIEILQISPQHLDRLSSLPFHHKDPFDRLMIAQSFAENMPLLTRDSAFGAYGVSMIW
jgi:PIN domain nuclease of toxin-antitoxin system